MSKSYLYQINESFYLKNMKSFDNSWLFSPMIWTCLCAKYLPKIKIAGEMRSASFFGPGGERNWKRIDIIVNESADINLRLLWELSNQQFFCSKDKELIADAVDSFFTLFPVDEDGQTWPYHIKQRFDDVANNIRAIDQTQCPYFVWKNSSCDDSLTNAFFQWRAVDGKEMLASMKDTADNVNQEFVIIQDGQIKNYVSCKRFVQR